MQAGHSRLIGRIGSSERTNECSETTGGENELNLDMTNPLGQQASCKQSKACSSRGRTGNHADTIDICRVKNLDQGRKEDWEGVSFRPREKSKRY